MRQEAETMRMEAGEKLHEECGVFGVYAPKMTDVAVLDYYRLYALQHHFLHPKRHG